MESPDAMPHANQRLAFGICHMHMLHATQWTLYTEALVVLYKLRLGFPTSTEHCTWLLLITLRVVYFFFNGSLERNSAIVMPSLSFPEVHWGFSITSPPSQASIKPQPWTYLSLCPPRGRNVGMSTVHASLYPLGDIIYPCNPSPAATKFLWIEPSTQ